MAAPMMVLAAAAAVKAIGAVTAGNSQAAGYNASAASHDFTADRLDENAQIAYQQAGVREDAQRRKGHQVLGQQRAAFAQSGIDSTSGSSALVQEQSADETNLDALYMRYEGNLQARGLKTQAEQERYGGRIDRMNARTAKVGGYMGAATSALSFAASYARGGG